MSWFCVHFFNIAPVVHEKTIGDDGKKTQKVEIYYKFVGVVEIEEGSIKEADR